MGITAEAQFHVLAVDDSLIDRKLIERLLKTSSYQVTTVESGRKALEFLGLQDEQRLRSSPSVSPCQQEIEVNLVITDYCMPGMTGYDLLKKIKESSSKKNIPVVIMSSEHVPSRINRCLEEGAEEFLLKPVQLSDMKRLRPHILKGKSKDQQQQLKQQQQVVPPPPPPPPPPLSPLSPQPQQNNNHHNNNATGITTTNSSSNNNNNNNNNNNKRKALDEGLSPAERTRPRYTVAA